MYNFDIKFKDWLLEFDRSTLDSEKVDSTAIRGLYGKSERAVDLVRQYDMAEGEHKWLKDHLKWQGPRNDFGYLLNISTIAPLAGNIYGLFNSRENSRVLDQNIKKDGIKFELGKKLNAEEMKEQDLLKAISYDVIRQKFPDVDPNKLHDTSIIHVNVPKIVNDLKISGLTGSELDKAIIREIASTIVHESTHQLERAWLGRTDEAVPKQAEKRFVDWLSRNAGILDAAAK
jgi:hypothetical protein